MVEINHKYKLTSDDAYLLVLSERLIVVWSRPRIVGKRSPSRHAGHIRSVRGILPRRIRQSSLPVHAVAAIGCVVPRTRAYPRHEHRADHEGCVRGEREGYHTEGVVELATSS